MIWTATLTVGGLGLISGAALALAARFLSVKEDPRIENVLEVLPGANCGGCGFAGCADYAKAIVLSGAAVNLCAPASCETLQKLATLMGVAATAVEKKTAIVLCGGDSSKAPRKHLYNGVADCAAANAVGGGDKLCRYGCLGYGNCCRVCPTGAIEITPHSLAVVHPELCIGCGACVKTCPRHLIQMIPASRKIHVLCSSKDRGPVVKKACSVGCIGCTACTKVAKNGEIVMDGALARMDYTKPLDDQAVIDKCPTHCIIRRSGEKSDAQ